MVYFHHQEIFRLFYLNHARTHCRREDSCHLDHLLPLEAGDEAIEAVCHSAAG